MRSDQIHSSMSSEHGAALNPVSGLFTDLYELTMMQAYVEEGMHDEAVFSLYVRDLPQRNFLVACGLDTVLGYLENLRFSSEDIAWLASLGRFSESFLGWLQAFRFTGDVHAMAEGTPVFANEPLLEVVAPLPQAQLVETLIINQIQLQTLLASKAGRVVAAAQGRPVLDFGARRMHGLDAALKSTRAFAVAGIAGTSNMLGGKVYGVPVAGTMAHSYIQAHDDEDAAFTAFARLYPDTVLLVDTYDTLEGVRKVIAMARRQGTDFRIRGVRLDSGDLHQLACAARQLLDEAGLPDVQIIASGGLDEYGVADLVARGAPIDGFGVGTSMGVSDDAPTLDIVYKLCEYAGKGRLKLSTGKPVLPGRKQVCRRSDGEHDVGDVIARADEQLDGEPLLQPVMRGGRRLAASPALESLRADSARRIARLPQAVRALEPARPPWPVAVSPALKAYQQAVRDELTGDGRN